MPSRHETCTSRGPKSCARTLTPVGPKPENSALLFPGSESAKGSGSPTVIRENNGHVFAESKQPRLSQETCLKRTDFRIKVNK